MVIAISWHYWIYYIITNGIEGELSHKGEQHHRCYGYIITGAIRSGSEMG